MFPFLFLAFQTGDQLTVVVDVVAVFVVVLSVVVLPLIRGQTVPDMEV